MNSKPEEKLAELGEVLKDKGDKIEKSKSRKKEFRSVEAFLKSISSLTHEEKLKVSLLVS